MSIGNREFKRYLSSSGLWFGPKSFLVIKMSGVKLFVGAIFRVFVGSGLVLPALLFFSPKPEHIEEQVLVNLPLLAHDCV